MSTLSSPPARVELRCGHCGFGSQPQPPGTLARVLARVDAAYQRVGHALTRPDDLSPAATAGGWSAIDYLIHVRDALYDYTTVLAHLAHLAQRDCPAADGQSDIQPVSSDYDRAVLLGLSANIERLQTLLETFPADSWSHQHSFQGQTLNAFELANYAVHEALHHLYDLERLANL